MLPLKEFLALSETKKILGQPYRKILSESMNRDPMRTIYYDTSYFLSPADGFIMYSKVVDPGQDIVEVKGGHYTVNELLREELKEKCLIIGIFMTVCDVHINRIPTNGFVSYEKLPSLKVMNMSMRPVEEKLLEGMGFNTKDLTYGFWNERMRNKVICPQLNQCYYILQMADFEVDTIVPFDADMAFFTQGERFSLVRLGSQVDLIIPFMGKKKFTSLVDGKELYHCEAGLDKLVRIEKA